MTHALRDRVDHVETTVGDRTARAVEQSGAAAEKQLGTLTEGVASLNPPSPRPSVADPKRTLD